MTKIYNQRSTSDWKIAVMANAPGVSRVLLIYDLAQNDILHQGISGLARTSVFPKQTPFPVLLPMLESGWDMSVIAPRKLDASTRIDNAHMTWALAYTWNRAQGSAWETLLKAQDLVRTRRFTMSPDLIVPLMFLARMATRSQKSKAMSDARQVATQAVLLEHAHRELLPLIGGLGYRWATGPSRSAALYRAIARTPLLLQPEQQEALSTFESLFGPQIVQDFLPVEHFEAALIRLLERMSAHLWEHNAVVSTPSEGVLAAALLPIARWQEDSPGPTTLQLEAQDEINTLLREWKKWAALKEAHE